ncbi:MAG: SDR family oxidoreductase [Deltaproteobacteria bacterium]|nr:MAG: SDR family oxidoreductase [Deltaproteobacteria bacterium]
MKIQGKTFVVTGGGSGMGKELVLQLLARGAQVAAVDIRQETLDALSAEAKAGTRLSTHVANIADRKRVEALVQEVLDHHKVVDGLLNNAGIIQPFVPVKDLDYDVIERVINVNLYGTIYMTKAFLPHLLERPEAHLLNVSSMGGFMPFPGQSIYGATKAGVKLLTEGLYAELIETKVGVSVVMPGAVGTNITKNSGVGGPTQESAGNARMTSAEDAAKIMLNGIEKNRLHIFVGSDAKATNWMIRIAPKRAINFIQKQMKKLLG